MFDPSLTAGAAFLYLPGLFFLLAGTWLAVRQRHDARRLIYWGALHDAGLLCIALGAATGPAFAGVWLFLLFQAVSRLLALRALGVLAQARGDVSVEALRGAGSTCRKPALLFVFGLMAAVGGTLVKHYRELAYMGFIPVLLHLRTIFANMKRCKDDIVAWQPDVVILVDYPGFNLSIAKFVHARTRIPVYYYISPKIWAWKEYRIKNIKRDVDELFSILPFEVEFFEQKHGYPIHYVGNPTVDEVTAFRAAYHQDFESFAQDNGLSSKPVIALLAGSRKQEIKDNLPDMLRAASAFEGYQLVLAGAPGISPEYYQQYTAGADVKIVFGQTYALLSHARVALVTSGTATLETALFRVPQAVCYHTPVGKLIAFLRRHLLKVKYISLVNLIADREVVKELVADTMTVEQVRAELRRILSDDAYRRQMLDGYDYMASRLGQTGAPARAAAQMVHLLRNAKPTRKAF